MRVCSLFAGIGGFDLAFERLGHTIIYANELDHYASEIYEKHFKTPCDIRSIRTVQALEIPEHDILVAGFPCQSFSVAGRRNGFMEDRGTLFFEIARILREKQPPLLLLENVKGLLSHDKGETFATILRTLDELGYDTQWQVLNSKNFGVPQNRERVFIIGNLRRISQPEIFPLLGYDKEATSENKSTSLDANYWKGVDNHGQRTMITVPVLTPERIQKRQNGRRFKEDGEPAFTLTAQDRHGVYDGIRIRKLTPLECERLQGFPDGWTEGISDTQRYKCLGNAVTVNVVEEIVKRL